MVKVKCSLCDYTTEDVDATVVVELLKLHTLLHAPASSAPQPKLERPRIDVGVEEEVWNSFMRRWEAFKVGSAITETTAPMQLFQCASETLGDLILKHDPLIHTKDIKTVLEAMQSFAVIPVATGVRRAELMQLRQAPDENFRTFAAKVKGKAETCAFQTSAKCECGKPVVANYTTETVKDVLLAGISDLDIRREALSLTDIPKKSVNDLISFVEGREMARNATPSAHSLSALSSYRKGSASPHQGPSTAHQSTTAVHKTSTCPDCKKKFQVFKQRPNGSFNSKPFTKCLDCWRACRRKPDEPPSTIQAISTEPVSVVQQLSALESVDPNKIISKSDLKRKYSQEHPRVQVCVGKPGSAKQSTVMAVADSGAMSNLWSLKEFLDSGFKRSDLTPVTIDIRAANKMTLEIVGYFVAKIDGICNNGDVISCNAKIFVSDNVDDFFLSYDTMLDLGILARNFPTIGVFCQDQGTTVQATLSTEADNVCKCPKRESVPTRPEKLPFTPSEENNGKMKEWLLDMFKSSTFNTCPHSPLPSMIGPPIEIHVSEAARPKACHTAATVALHWQEQVHKDLIRDEALGVIEKVPYGEPVEWCHRMVVTRKHDGTPRRTVDLSPLNKYCKRETFAAEAPFPLARRVPGKTWKSVMDAWNGYHSVPLREEDRHLTTFITPFGRWRYRRAPQGYLSSGDGYNRRFDAILSDFERKERCVDDTIFHDVDLETHWWRAIDFLITCGRAGIVINPKKFQFCQREVDFAGFRITEDKIQPLPRYVEAIRAFPTPTCTTDIRSWFGLVNRVANYAKLREAMRLFKPFLSPKRTFFWSEVLDKAFNESKNHIIASILEGVEIFDMTKPTCLRPDWSKNGIGYILLQKHCHCTSELPDCCDNGWRITLAGSRFLKGPEERYAAIEGEALAIVWGLEQSKYFTQGCPDLIVVTDHKPLTKIFGDRSLDEISNTRLFRLKQKTLPWYFRVKHMAGDTNCAADAMSRHPVMPPEEGDDWEEEENKIIAGICRDIADISTISWSDLAKETDKDDSLVAVKEYLSGIDDSYQVSTQYERYIDFFYVHEGVVMYQDRVVIPTSLRKVAMTNLHAAHQGVSTMEMRASKIMFWPGMTEDIKRVRAACTDCNINAPSQASLPSSPARPPSTPFEKVFADFFDYAGNHYLIIGDRLSGWPEVYSTPKGSNQAGAKGLIACLRTFFATFGVPEELSSDGGPEFVANETQTFLARWGVAHRKSSAYHPQSNGRAEVAVKSAKRLLRSNVAASGSLNSDKFLRALLQLRNTPDQDCDISPAQIVFGRPLNDAFSFINRLEKYNNQAINPIWREAWQLKEQALRARFMKTSEVLNRHARNLKQLCVGDRCFVQNQTGPNPNRWDRTGIVLEVHPHDQYTVKVDGSGRLTTRNRKFLRYFQPASMEIQPAPKAMPPITSLDSESQSPKSTLSPLPKAIGNDTTPVNEVHDTLRDIEHPLNIGHDTIPHTVRHTDVIEPSNNSQTINEGMIQEDKIHTSLKRLLPHNKEGLRENSNASEHNIGRRLRSGKIIDGP